MELELSLAQRARLESGEATSTEIRNMAKGYAKNHALGLELWDKPLLGYRLLSILIMDKAHVPGLIDKLVADIDAMGVDAIEKLGEWLMANQIMNLKNPDAIIKDWSDDASLTRRSLFWSFQARTIRKNKMVSREQAALLDLIERRIQKAEPILQWNMNYCAAQIGIFDEALRIRCIGLGEQTGLFRDFKVSRGCTSPYLPSWINSEVRKNVNRA